MRRTASRLILILAGFLLAVLIAWLLFALWRNVSDARSSEWLRWWRGGREERDELVTVQRESCAGAPFVLPADGFIGLLYGDPRGPYSEFSPHQGIDIFSNSDPGITPVYAAYDGYLRREPDWKSSLILRIPDDPLNPGEQIWLYYTHMADRDGNDFILDSFPPGISEVFVPRGTLLGYTGDYNGASPRSIWVHLHFSVVKDDGDGRYLNELQFENTLDPAPYLGLPVNYACSADINTAMRCSPDPSCS